jgi:hypothetical protein
MRTVLRAVSGVAATVVSAAVLVATTAAPAAARTSEFCPSATSTRLLTANDGDYKLWLYQPGVHDLYVCFGALDVVRGAFEFHTGVTGTLVPTVTPTVAGASCPDLLHVQDPAEVVVQLQASLTASPVSLCFGLGDGSAVRIDVAMPTGTASPREILWLDHGTAPAAAYCDTIGWINPSCDPAKYDAVWVA